VFLLVLVSRLILGGLSMANEEQVVLLILQVH
jgi:hypothetical protein